MNLTFMCGCTTGNVESRANLTTMDSVGYDNDGFVICLVHHQRRYGWASVPQTSDDRGKCEISHLIQYTPLEREAFYVFGEALPILETYLVDVLGEGDIRDNRSGEDAHFDLVREHPHLRVAPDITTSFTPGDGSLLLQRNQRLALASIGR